MNRKHFIWIGILIAILPLFLTIGVVLFAALHRCSLNLDGVAGNFCIIDGINHGPLLYGLLHLIYLEYVAIPIGGVITTIGFKRKSNAILPTHAVVPNVVSNTNQFKRLIWIGLALIFFPSIFEFLFALFFTTHSTPIYIGIGFAKIFGRPFGIVLLIVGIAKHFSSKK